MPIFHEHKDKEKPYRPGLSRTVKLSMLMVLGIILWVALMARGKPVIKGSYIDKKNGFAVIPLENWVPVTPETFSAVHQNKDIHISPEIQQELQTGQIAYALVRAAVYGEVTPAIYIKPIPMTLPLFTAKNQQAMSMAATEQVQLDFENYEKTQEELIRVDAIASLKITGQTKIPARDGSKNIQIIQVFIRGLKMGYVIIGISSNPREGEASITQLLETFRVLKRPSLF